MHRPSIDRLNAEDAGTMNTIAARKRTLAALAVGCAVAGCGPAPAAPTSLAASAPTVTAATSTAPAPTASPMPIATAVPSDPTQSATAQASPPADAPADACADPSIAQLGVGWNFVIATAPSAGAQVQTGFRLRGCGDVFEADFGWRLRDAAGAILVDDHAMMSCGTGCVGTFDLPVSYPPQAQPQMGSLEIYTTSMADGAEQLRAVIPVVLH